MNGMVRERCTLGILVLALQKQLSQIGLGDGWIEGA